MQNDMKSDRKQESLRKQLEQRFSGMDISFKTYKEQLTLKAPTNQLVELLTVLRDEYPFKFEMLVDLCGVDYSELDNAHDTPRFAVVYHLLSISQNHRLRIRAVLPDDGFPEIASVVRIWPSANWFEREAFDLFGIVFRGHPDLRRILTDYGFVGHPFRKDFPMSGHVEMRYDPTQKRVVYQPVTIEPREVNPRKNREDEYGKE